MGRRRYLFPVLLPTLLVTLPAVSTSSAGPPPALLALRGARIHTAAGPPIAAGAILVEKGKIAAVGSDLLIPANARVVDVSGKVIIPGMMDNHSHIGGGSYFGQDDWDLNEFPVPVGPEYRVLDALILEDASWHEAVRGGVTTVVTGPGSSEAISGQAVVIKTFGNSLDERILTKQGGIKFAMGQKHYGQQNRYPGTAMGTVTIQRETFIKAQEYMEAWEQYKAGKRAAPPKVDLGLEQMAKVLKGENRVRAHVHSATDVLSILRMKDEFGFDLTLHHSTEAYKVADEIAKRNVGAVVLPLFVQIGISDDILRGNRILYEAGVKLAMHTDHPVTHQKWLRLCAALAMRYGIPEEEALKTVTINPAEFARVDDRVGSIEVSKDADLVVLDGPWYEPKTRVEMVFVDGTLAYDRSQEELQ